MILDPLGRPVRISAGFTKSIVAGASGNLESAVSWHTFDTSSVILDECGRKQPTATKIGRPINVRRPARVAK